MRENYSFEKQYTLLAQTPLVHFQSRQWGATLRATEVKPKLDRFLHHKMKEKPIPSNWYMGSTKALNYKLHFRICGKRETVPLNNRAYDICYAARSGSNKDSGQELGGILANVTMSVICMVKELRELIDSCIGEFFLVHNFGYMQNKGFGSFVLEGDEQADVATALKAYYGAKKCYTFQGNGTPFAAIKAVYGVMKSGINFRGYQRSSLFLFLHTDEFQIGNEKAWLKQNGAPADVGYHCEKWQRNSDHAPHYVRALLGVGDHLDFIKDLNNRNDKVTYILKGKKGEVSISRLSSPIFFKVVGDNVYYVARKINKVIFGATFLFSRRKEENKKESIPIGTLTVPTEEQLGEDFMERFLDYHKDTFNQAAATKFERNPDVARIRIQEV